jgi:two-component system response regulator BasR
VQARLLITEDNQSLTKAYLALLARLENVKVDCAASAREARALLTTNRYEAACLDIELSDEEEGGFDVLESFKTTNPDSPVMMMSSRDDPTTVKRCFQAGAAVFASKNQDFLVAFPARVQSLLQ